MVFIATKTEFDQIYSASLEIMSGEKKYIYSRVCNRRPSNASNNHHYYWCCAETIWIYSQFYFVFFYLRFNCKCTERKSPLIRMIMWFGKSRRRKKNRRAGRRMDFNYYRSHVRLNGSPRSFFFSIENSWMNNKKIIEKEGEKKYNPKRSTDKQ